MQNHIRRAEQQQQQKKNKTEASNGIVLVSLLGNFEFFLIEPFLTQMGPQITKQESELQEFYLMCRFIHICC